MKDKKLQKLVDFLSIEREKQVNLLAQYNNLTPKESKMIYTDKEVYYLRLFTGTLSKIRAYSEFIDIINEME